MKIIENLYQFSCLDVFCGRIETNKDKYMHQETTIYDIQRQSTMHTSSTFFNSKTPLPWSLCPTRKLYCYKVLSYLAQAKILKKSADTPSPPSEADLDCGGEELVVVDCLGSVADDQDSEDSEDEGWYSLSRYYMLNIASIQFPVWSHQ